MAVNSVPSSTSLVEEVNWLAPGRDKSSDGTIGDSAHASSASNHNPDETGNTGGNEDSDSINEVHARDIDNSGPWPPGWNMERIVQIILARCRAGIETRAFEIIYNRRIWTAARDWIEREYRGSNPHDHHAHFSFRYGSGSGQSNPENRTGPWGIREARELELAPPKQEDEMDIQEYFASIARAVAVPADPNVTKEDRANRDAFASGLRFALGYNKPYDQDTLPGGALTRIADASEQLVEGADGGAEPGGS